MAKDFDRQRLRQIERTDITEGRLNEDLVDWLKTKGPTWLLVVLVGVTAYLAYHRWSQYKASQVNQAWIDLVNTDRPESLEEVAETHAGVFAVPLLAREQAADAYLRAVVSGRDFSDDPAMAPQLTDEQRADYLAKADRLYESIANEAKNVEGDRNGKIHAVYAVFGRAAVAEAKGDVEAAKKFYDEAASLAGSTYPALADQARKRAGDVAEAAKPVHLPTIAELPQQTPGETPRKPLEIDDSLENLIFPLESTIDQHPPAAGDDTQEDGEATSKPEGN